MKPTTIPILPSWDFDATSSWYSIIGFEERGRWPDSYLIIEHPIGIELHFFHCAPFPAARNDHGAYIRFSTAQQCDDLHDSWSVLDLGHGKLNPPSETEYGLREFSILDPMRNLLRLGGVVADPD